MRWSLERIKRPCLRGLLAGVVDGLNRRRLHRRLAMREAEIQTGSKSMAQAHGGTRKPGRPRCLHRIRGTDDPLIKSRRCEGHASQRAKKRANGDTAERR